jgi:hypothetical protein
MRRCRHNRREIRKGSREQRTVNRVGPHAIAIDRGKSQRMRSVVGNAESRVLSADPLDFLPGVANRL